MAFVLARLRLAIQIGGARASALGIATFALGWALGIVVGLCGGALVATLDSGFEAFGDLLVLLLFVALFVGWAVLPITTPLPIANIIDPTVLEQYPLSRTQQVSGLLLGGLFSPTAAATFLTAIGGVAQVHVDLASRLAAVAAGLLFTVMCVATSYAVRALFAEALSARRGRDLAVVLSSLVVVSIYVLPHVFAPILGAAENAGAILVTVLTWTPPGAAAAVGYVLDAGDLPGALARFGIVIVTIVLALLLWGVALRRHVKGHTARAVASPHRRSARELPLVPPVLRPFSAGAALGAASQQLRYYFFRAPRAAQFLIVGPVVGVMFAVAQVHTTGLPFAAAIGTVAMASGVLLNLFAWDGRGIELTVQTGASLASVLRGKMLAVSLFLVPAVAAVTIGLGIASGTADQIPTALISALAALALSFAVGAVSSSRNAYDQEAPQGDRSTLVVRALGATGAAIGLVPAAGWLSTLVQAFLPVDVVLLAALVLAVVGAVVAIRVSGDYLDRHPDRLLAAFSPR